MDGVVVGVGWKSVGHSQEHVGHVSFIALSLTTSKGTSTCSDAGAESTEESTSSKLAPVDSDREEVTHNVHFPS